MGLALRLDELLGPEVPNDQNAAYLYEKAFDTLLDYEDDSQLALVMYDKLPEEELKKPFR